MLSTSLRAPWRGLAAAALVAAFTTAAQAQQGLEPLTVVSGAQRHAFQVEVAADPEARARGLMFRTELGADRGMLFDFHSDQPVAFWMKNTYVSLDMLFARSDGTIVRIAEATTPLSEREVPSGMPVRFVLEVVAGTAKRLGIKAGDRIEHRLVGR